MPKLLLTILLFLLMVLAAILGEAAETSRAARSVVVAVFVVALFVPSSQIVGLVLRRLGPHVVNHYHYDNRSIVLRNDAPQVPQVPQVSEPERSQTTR